MTYTQEQFDRLPKWAQATVREAERTQEQAKDALELNNAIGEGMKTRLFETALDPVPGSERWRGEVVAFRNPYDEDAPVARYRDVVRFTYGSRPNLDWVDVSVKHGMVEIMGASSLIVRHHTGNLFYVKNDER